MVKQVGLTSLHHHSHRKATSQRLYKTLFSKPFSQNQTTAMKKTKMKKKGKERERSELEDIPGSPAKPFIAKKFDDGNCGNPLQQRQKHPTISRGTMSRNCNVKRAMEDLVLDICILRSNL
ncbi:hypothetical protein AAC387_Pa01g2900 [Persea americana]